MYAGASSSCAVFGSSSGSPDESAIAPGVLLLLSWRDLAHAISAQTLTAEKNLDRTARKKRPRQAPKVAPGDVGVQPENQRLASPSEVVKAVAMCMAVVELLIPMSMWAGCVWVGQQQQEG